MNDMLLYKDYYATVKFSAGDSIFFGKIEGVNDLVSFEGKSVAELKSAFRASVNDYIETCKALDKSCLLSFPKS